MGCINGVVNLKSPLSRPSNEDLFMFFGADVSYTMFFVECLLIMRIELKYFSCKTYS
jgi:hypothetical protein